MSHGGSPGRHQPRSALCCGDAENAEAGQVDCGGQEGEVGGDLGGAADPGSSAAVSAAHQVSDLAFHLGSGGAVVGEPLRCGLPLPGLSEAALVPPDPDAAPTGGFGALGPQRAAGAGRPELRDPGPVFAAADRRGLPGRAAHGVGVKINIEGVLGEQSVRGAGRLGLALGVDPGLGQPVLELPGAVGVVAVDTGRIRAGTTVGVPARRWIGRIGLAVVGIGLGGGGPGQQIRDQVLSDARIAGVARADLSAGDDL